jgi:hypothetical protein
LNQDKPISRNKVYLRVLANGDFLPLHPFFIFDNDTRVLYIYSEISDQGKPILRCPYEAPGAKTIYLDLDASIILGNIQGEVTITSTSSEKETNTSKAITQPEDPSLAKTDTVSNHKQEIIAVDQPDQEKHLLTPEIPSVPASLSRVRQKNLDTTNISTPLTNLEKALRQAPVMGQFHPLVSLCLADEVETISEPDLLVEELDGLAHHSERPILVTHLEPKFAHRFTVMN